MAREWMVCGRLEALPRGASNDVDVEIHNLIVYGWILATRGTLKCDYVLWRLAKIELVMNTCI